MLNQEKNVTKTEKKNPDCFLVRRSSGRRKERTVRWNELVETDLVESDRRKCLVFGYTRKLIKKYLKLRIFCVVIIWWCVTVFSVRDRFVIKPTQCKLNSVFSKVNTQGMQSPEAAMRPAGEVGHAAYGRNTYATLLLTLT